MHNPAPVVENDTHKLLWDFDIHTDHLISSRRPDLIIIYKKREFAKFAVPADHNNIGTMTKGLLKGLEDLEIGRRGETIQMTALLRTARILKRVLETWGYLQSLKLQWKTIC